MLMCEPVALLSISIIISFLTKVSGIKAMVNSVLSLCLRRVLSGCSITEKYPASMPLMLTRGFPVKYKKSSPVFLIEKLRPTGWYNVEKTNSLSPETLISAGLRGPTIHHRRVLSKKGSL
jgi:hypothetical protein